MVKVFVSHKDTDEDVARDVASRLRTNGVGVYLDAVDPALVKDGPELSDYLLGRMEECEQLIAVVSAATAASWWVPWEIGVGSEKGFRMASFSRAWVELPTYLRKWPDLRSLGDVDIYCRLSVQADQRVRSAKARVLSESARMTAQKSGAANFHRELKSALGRGR